MMKKLLFMLLFFSLPTSAYAELTTTMSLQSRYFDDASTWVEKKTYTSASIESEYKATFSDDTQTVTVTPFGRYDVNDEGRRYLDLREANWSLSKDNDHWRVGISRVNWGVMEVFKLVDIINQKDANALPDREKLGQPMLAWSTYVGDDLVDLYVLEGLREVDFPDDDGRFRYPFTVDDKHSEHEWGATGATDFAFRWKKQWGSADIAVSHFYGMNRNPYFTFNFDFKDPRLIPVYEKINQTSLDGVLTLDDILFKFEALFQTGDLQRFGAVAVGVEKTFGAVFHTAVDVTALAEATYDSRDNNIQTPYDRDVFLGTRIAFNDSHENSLLVGAVVDARYRQYAGFAQWNMNVGEAWKLRFAASIFESREPAIDRSALDEAVFSAYDAIENRRLPLDAKLVQRLLDLAQHQSLNGRDVLHFLDFLRRNDALESLLDLPPQQVADTLNTLLSLSSPSQKMHWMEDDDFIQCEISYYF